MDPAHHGAHRRLWTDVVRRAQPGYVAAPACLLAVTAWQGGDGALANIALDRALADTPGYSMALLLRDVLDAGAPPSAATPPMTPEQVAASYASPATAGQPASTGEPGRPHHRQHLTPIAVCGPDPTGPRTATWITDRAGARRPPAGHHPRPGRLGHAPAGLRSSAQTALPVPPPSVGYQPHRALKASTSRKPRPLSASKPGSMRNGGLGLASPATISTRVESETSHSRTGGGGGGSRREASTALLISSETTSPASSFRTVKPHSRQHQLCVGAGTGDRTRQWPQCQRGPQRPPVR